MKRIAALILTMAMVLPMLVFGTAAAEPAAQALTEADLAPKAAYTIAANSGIDLGTGNLLLVNYDHQVSTDFVFSDMVTISGGRVLKPTMDLRSATKIAYEAMSKAMDKAGLKLYICSGYRTYDYQRNLFVTRLQSRMNNGMDYATAFADTNLYTAYPGTSEHETGMAIDLAKDVNATLNDAFATTAVGKWLKANCADYGFILRYTKEKYDITKIAYEPWHFRYVGLPHSQIITDNNWALEEYLAYLQAGNQITLREEDGTWTVTYTRDYSQIARMKNVDSYSYDNCGGWVVTCWTPTGGYHVKGHWSEPYFEQLLAGRTYEGQLNIVPDQPIPVEGFQYLYSLIRGLQQPLWGDMQYVSRQSAAVAMAGIFGRQTEDSILFLDQHLIAPWARDSVNKLSAVGILRGTTDGRFNPEATITWAEAATMLARLKTYLGK